MKVDFFLFCLSLQEMTTSLLDGIFVREEQKRSPRWIRQIAEEYSLLVNPGWIHKMAGYC